MIVDHELLVRPLVLFWVGAAARLMGAAAWSLVANHLLWRLGDCWRRI